MASDLASRAVPGRSVPGLRVLASQHFRLLLAVCAVSVGLVVNALYIYTLHRLQMPILPDLEVYYGAAQRVAQGQPLYLGPQLEGPFDIWCHCFLYPPLLAQALVPAALLPLSQAKVLWFGLMTGAAFASTWLSTGIGGASRSLERLLWCAAATLLFFPVLDGNVAGNVSSLVALSATMVALGGVAAGFGAAVALLVKVVPGALAPAALVASRESRSAFLLLFAMIAGASFLLAPTDWLDFPTMFWNLMAGSNDYDRNVALANVAVRVGLSDSLVLLLRATTIVVGVGGLVLSVMLARRSGGMPAAALAGTVAMLTLPATLWPHYLAVLLPFAAMAWPQTGVGTRLSLLVASAVLAAGCVDAHYGATYVGATSLVLVAGWVVWPRDRLSPA